MRLCEVYKQVLFQLLKFFMNFLKIYRKNLKVFWEFMKLWAFV
ncbi:hypothetical protein K691_0032 [Campylobacter jejuni HB-CJGB-XWM]|nr:hypothetical protein CJS3_1806 [Campylobacter jejuni subsp. jejuni S3]EAL56184.1 hypothetical protein CCO0030 [Campylobacter coli RM2228]EAQ56267.1 conserved hypothetical protein [Campylobacter jejuni subsp. jejuni CF93-6]EFM36936.1 hypothetical protein HMPREF9399_1092 [Campylobacter coli JV20]KUY35386.1 hypothetical protein K691_0032 [Campylobacter jejuni HB-CJGB-XWM]KUY36529.1 hypothetical protein K687_0031 [Campylobacter jejuni HB-CJGB-LL]